MCVCVCVCVCVHTGVIHNKMNINQKNKQLHFFKEINNDEFFLSQKPVSMAFFIDDCAQNSSFIGELGSSRLSGAHRGKPTFNSLIKIYLLFSVCIKHYFIYFKWFILLNQKKKKKFRRHLCILEALCLICSDFE